ncbi:MAG TPA: DUF2600 family protein, partial [Solirubrobacteraceae bacterium]
MPLFSGSVLITGATPNPSPLSGRQLWALVAVATREIACVIPTVSREVGVWRDRARAIPDAPIREDALGAIAEKRFNPEGAALFAVLPRRYDLNLVRLLVAFQVLLDFLDSVTE